MSRPDRVYHVSEQAGIAEFAPRPSRGLGARVWAISDDRLHNYLLPRDCPRVTFYASNDTSASDVARFLPDHPTAVVAVELAWLRRIRATPLRLYVFDARPFTLEDPIAGYYVADRRLRPLMELAIEDPIGALLARNVELRVLESLTALRTAVIASTLGFSIIRWRNAGSSAPAMVR